MVAVSNEENGKRNGDKVKCCCFYWVNKFISSEDKNSTSVVVFFLRCSWQMMATELV